VIYLDSSALAKLVVAEPESGALIDWLNKRADPAGEITVVTSTIGRIDLLRAAMRSGAAAVAAASQQLDTIDTLVLTDAIVAKASTIGPVELCPLCAIHLATADAYRESVTAMCTYDNRIRDAAKAQGLPVVSPGRS
jgi:predicted nucleic acid-binding protein